MFKELNTYKRTIREDVDTKDMEFRSLAEFCGKKIKVDGFFFTDGEYGRQVVVVGNGYLINMPKRAVVQFDTIDADNDMVEAVLKGKLVINHIKMVHAKNGDTAAYELEDA
jgi:hypothetical protein